MRNVIAILFMAIFATSAVFAACPADCNTRHTKGTNTTQTGVQVTCGEIVCPADYCNVYTYGCGPSSGCNKCTDDEGTISECMHYVCQPNSCTGQPYNVVTGPIFKTVACPQ